MSDEENDYTSYVARYLPHGRADPHEDEEIYCPNPPQTGEYLNRSGCYSKVIAVLQHFDQNIVEVFLEPIGDSREFLEYLKRQNGLL